MICSSVHRDGITGGMSIKVGKMVPACCECKPAGASRTRSLKKRLSLTRYVAEVGPSATVRNHTRQREENE